MSRLAFLNTVFKFIQGRISSRFNLPALKQQYNATGESIINVKVYDGQDHSTLLFDRNYKLGENTIIEVKDAKPDSVAITDFQTILDILNGEKVENYRGRIIRRAYDIIDAYGERRLITHGGLMNSNYLGDLKLFEYLYMQILPQLRDELVAKKDAQR